ncbi:uncharacterized protein YbaP (TraB family) [Dysgonomonas sp. PFB1-18]|uniref:TraB/GumN family protein n=1 Tax=unclassified Dysgonomonas TaxID=2630389 RepID=UPI0024739CA9|nr:MULTISPECIES: TraB/GumN family protein [unclassified Dysgonomonas]MDL2303139.1 TraB/GumN family protein [Dysgonomonas sp. OttesenSCG-928-D17]MDH6308174.1 uncharacterized protein YbaP (TraB family) [Dysgonomonas sp. PF1-14]MDH6338387.1 uncharacterized protein YbaP (TraB family) [Dysgonomonas sp. PF1-16]MDH6379884.1 uncharacterized protein YbaP (TraB family) [Dysgonomonas sp. PFB1-18]MDH6397026.1 uncharacterized protein YbaP (TraB family) [Dysgonomonas sp. PF1-23]
MKAITTLIIGTLLAMISLLTVSAQGGTPESYTGSLLWKVSGNGLTSPSYILGTHHLVHISFVNEISGLKDAMESTEQTVGEVVMSNMATMQQKVLENAKLPEGETYQNLLSEADYKKLDEGLIALVTAGLAQYGHFKPGMLSMFYSTILYSKLYPEFNPASHEAIDAYLQRIATEKGKPVLGMETIEDQVYALFDAEPLKTQAEDLVCMVSNGENSKEQLDQLNAFYKAADLTGMYNLAYNNPDDPCPSTEIRKNVMMKDRNDRWIEKLPAIMKEKSSLIAAGALHLAGEEGLLYQLAKLGYTVEPVR